MLWRNSCSLCTALLSAITERVDGRALARNKAPRTVLEPFEAAWILQKTEAEVRRELRRRRSVLLTWSGHRRRVDAQVVAELVLGDAVATAALERLLGGAVVAPRADSPEDPPPPLR